ncbi:hypothetical protein GIB67_041026 [Kingdonia uniflora]|uniref:Uncharacterized protein n=1 Tax=Kingdonia uniflora TaxID=39325 RepID=A0A7J7NCJ2_9MAGN|nr:hypothetical protein GIB67_041026 [Kingdonia uniflora]
MVVMLNWIELRSFFTVTLSNGCPCRHIIRFPFIVNRGGLDSLSGLLFGSFITRIYHCIKKQKDGQCCPGEYGYDLSSYHCWGVAYAEYPSSMQVSSNWSCCGISKLQEEPSTVTSIVQGPLFSHPPSASHNGSQGATSLQTSSPSSTSQEKITNGDNNQEFKPIMNVMSHSARLLGSAAANVSILNNLSQARQVMSSASLTGETSFMGLQTINGIPMAMHMSNMISNGAAQNSFSSSQSCIASLVRTSQNAQNAVLGSFSTQAYNISGNSNHGMSPPLVNVQAAVTTGQSVPAIS